MPRALLECRRTAEERGAFALCPFSGHLFLGTSASPPCEGGTAGNPGPGDLALVDSNGDGGLDLSDAVFVLLFLFTGGGPPALGTECVPIVGCPEKCGA